MPPPAPYYQDESVVLYHGEALALLRELTLPTIAGVVTDPPYSSGGAFRGDRSQSVTAKYVQTDTGRKDFAEFSGDNRDQFGLHYWSALWLSEARQASAPGAFIATFTDWRQLPVTTSMLQAGGWVWRGISVWDKTEAARAIPGRMRAQCEFVAWGTNGASPTAGAPLPGVYREALRRSEKLHMTGKPAGLMTWLLAGVPASLREDPAETWILDPFAGSGTTLRAAKDLGMRAVGLEIEERYCEIAADRLRQGVLF